MLSCNIGNYLTKRQSEKYIINIIINVFSMRVVIIIMVITEIVVIIIIVISIFQTPVIIIDKCYVLCLFS